MIKTIKELEAEYNKSDRFRLGYEQAKEDVLGLIDEKLKKCKFENCPVCWAFEELKSKINGK